MFFFNRFLPCAIPLCFGWYCVCVCCTHVFVSVFVHLETWIQCHPYRGSVQVVYFRVVFTEIKTQSKIVYSSDTIYWCFHVYFHVHSTQRASHICAKIGDAGRGVGDHEINTNVHLVTWFTHRAPYCCFGHYRINCLWFLVHILCVNPMNILWKWRSFQSQYKIYYIFFPLLIYNLRSNYYFHDFAYWTVERKYW